MHVWFSSILHAIRRFNFLTLCLILALHFIRYLTMNKWLFSAAYINGVFNSLSVAWMYDPIYKMVQRQYLVHIIFLSMMRKKERVIKGDNCTWTRTWTIGRLPDIQAACSGVWLSKSSIFSLMSNPSATSTIKIIFL